ncbi:diguanylate cyclase [Acidihalobacter prosperus]
MRSLDETITQEIKLDEVLDSLTAHIAVLDSEGRVVYANESWVGFAKDNGANDPDAFVGFNYLDVCKQALGQEDGVAVAAYEGILAVLTGAQSVMTLEYPCSSPTVERWFILRATRYAGDSSYIVISHEDITSRKKAENELLKAKTELEIVNQKLDQALVREQRLANTDNLTEIGNRRYFLDTAGGILSRASDQNQVLSVLLFDIDHFKKVNDTMGHLIGDQVLKCVARTVSSLLRKNDIFARYGGEEYVALLPESRASEAVIIAERIRKHISEMCQVRDYKPITISIGIAEFPNNAQSLKDLLSCADRALYKAKRQGRNRTVQFLDASNS